MCSDIDMLVKVLNHFHEELTVCMDHKNAHGPFKNSDPIMLGDFIVDAFNDYLHTAQRLTDHPMVLQMQALERVPPDVRDSPEEIGRNPRVQKMHELALATKNLILFLEGAIRTGHTPARRTNRGVVILLESIGQQLEALNEHHHLAHLQGARFEDEYWRASLTPIVDMYNQALALIVSDADTDDPILSTLFHPLTVDASLSFGHVFSQVNVAHGCLLSYIRRQADRQEKPVERNEA